jgi:hypothetical protein
VVNWQNEPDSQLPASAFKLGFTIRHHYPYVAEPHSSCSK